MVPMMAPIQSHLEGQHEGAPLGIDLLQGQHERLGLLSGRPAQNAAGVGVAKITIVIFAMFASYHVRDLGYMNVINGAMSAGVFVALCPALIGLYLLEKHTDLPWQTAMYSLLVVGLLMSTLGLVFTDNYIGLMTGPSCVWSR